MTIKRKHMSMGVKLRAALLALGLDPDNVDWDHNPPLALRIWDEKAQDTVPPMNDPRYITPLSRPAHKIKTNGKPHTSYGSDKHGIAKARRIAKGGRTRKGPAIQSRGFDTRYRQRMNGTVEVRS